MAYEQFTPESAEDGESSDSGFCWGEDGTTTCTFKELIDYVEKEGFNNFDGSNWVSTDSEIIDYTDLTYESKSLHARNDRSLRYLKKAFNYVYPKKVR